MLTSLLALAEPEVRDGSGVAWEFVEGVENQEFHFEAESGVHYMVESSGNLVDWENFGLYRGVGDVVRVGLFPLLKGDGVVSGGGGEAEVPEDYVHPTMVRLRKSRVVDGAGNDLGFHFRWVSLVDGVSLRCFTVYGEFLHTNFPPVYSHYWGAFYYMMGGDEERVQVPPNDVLTGQDAEMVANFLDFLPEVNAEVEANIQHSLNTPRLPPLEDPNRFFRIRPFLFDSDGDGWTDDVEVAAGTDFYNRDSDGDGIEDPFDGEPLVNAAVSDPDGAGLAAGLDAGLLARWDFEPGAVGGALVDRSGYGRGLGAAGAGVVYSPGGMVSYAGELAGGHFGRQAGFLRDDRFSSSIDIRSKLSVSLWLCLDEGAIPADGSRVGVWNAGLSEYYVAPAVPGGTLQYAWNDTRTYGISVKRNVNGDELWGVGEFVFRNDHDGNPGSYLRVDPFGANPQTGATDGSEVKWVRPAGTSDTGRRWVHLVLVRDRKSVSGFPNGRTAVYVDGELAVEGAFRPWALESQTEWSGASAGMFLGQVYSQLGGQAPANGAFKGKVDRARIYGRGLSAGEVLALYRQDIDRDGLWDVSEQASLLWRDTNGDGVRTHDEDSYTVNPFFHDAADVDHDDDGLVSLLEQDVHGTNMAHPDSDGDLMPDGWEVDNGLDPKDGSDASGDGDGDGLSNLEEYSYNSDPDVEDSDGDGVDDGVEAGQGSLPSDASDDGLAIPEEERLSILLGVGDQSGSESEDYVMHVFEVDDQTAAETRIHTLRSGGHGEYEEVTKSFFRKSGTYSFQIDWQSSNLGSNGESGANADGADFDYTFKVEPVGEVSSLIVDKFDHKIKRADVTKPISGSRSDITDFTKLVEPSRVVLFPIEIYQPKLNELGFVERANGQDVLEKVEEVRPSSWFDAYDFKTNHYEFNRNFTSVDRDRFHIRFPVKWQLTEVQNMYLTDENSVAVKMEFKKMRQGSKTFFQSQGLILVLDEIDDGFNLKDGELVDGQDGDRTFLVMKDRLLSKDFTVRMNATNGEVTKSVDSKFKVEKPTHSLDLDLILLVRESETALNLENLEKLQLYKNSAKIFIDEAEHCYQRIGIDILPDVDQIQVKGIPNQVWDAIVSNDGKLDSGGHETQQLVTILNNLNPTKLQIVFVPLQFDGTTGFAFYPTRRENGHAFVSLGSAPENVEKNTMVHEIGHLLGHVTEDRIPDGFMVGANFPNNDHVAHIMQHNSLVPGTFSLSEDAYTDSKRFTLSQKKLFLMSPYMQLKP